MVDFTKSILLDGNNRLTFSVAACLLEAGCEVIVITEKTHELNQYLSAKLFDTLKVVESLENLPLVDLAIVITPEDEEQKKRRLEEISKCLPASVPIAVNSESIPLSNLQIIAHNPERVMIANWVEPVKSTLFLELVGNELADNTLIFDFENFAKNCLNKDPYIVKGELGYRSRLMASLVREAFFLIDNDYATFEDIDRACRNDSGYYLPFSGNLRYMDLMGTYAYGVVMKDLNPELANDYGVPGFLKNLINQGCKGMENGKGFYKYEEGEADNWKSLIMNFSEEIRELMDKYPFNHQLEQTPRASEKTYN